MISTLKVTLTTSKNPLSPNGHTTYKSPLSIYRPAISGRRILGQGIKINICSKMWGDG